MSSRWPSSLLNPTNQQLTEQIEQLSIELESKRSTIAETREVVELLKKNQQEVRRQEKATAEALASTREAVDGDEGKLKQVTQEVEGSARRVRSLTEEQTRLTAAVAAVESSMEHKRRRLEAEQQAAAAAEAQAKEIVLEHLARQKVGEELAAAQRDLSSTVWARLERLNAQVSFTTKQLAEARAEHDHVLRELNAVQHNLQDAVQDQSDSVRALELIHAQTTQLDARVATNAAAMQTLKNAAREREELRERLRITLEHCIAENNQRSAARDRERGRYDQQLYNLRQIMEGLREAVGQLTGCTSRHHAEEHFLQQQRRQLAHILHLCEEKAALLAVEKARHAALVKARAQLQKETVAGGPSPSALRDLLLSLSHQQELLENRLERAQQRLAEAIQIFVQEGRRGDHVNDALAEVQRRRKAVAETHDTTESEVHLVKQRCMQLEELLRERQALLPSMQALAHEQRAQRQESWVREVAQLRTRLLDAQREYQQLLQGVITLRGSVRRTRTSLDNGGAAQGSTLEEMRLLEGEVARLEQEAQSTAVQQQSAVAQAEQAGVTLQSLMKAADVQVGALKEAAGVESFLRAEVQIKEEQIEAEMQSRRVELHLHESEVHELNEELQRHRKKLGLLRMRYDEVMGALARASQKPLNEEQGDTSLALSLPPLDPAAASTNPEAVHAHLLLRRSFEREQLMQRGNYLDLRLVALGRETSTLRHMLEGLRAPSTSSAAPPIEGVGVVGKVLPGADTTVNGSGTTQGGALVSANVNSPLVVKSQLVSNEFAKERYWKEELELLDGAMLAMAQERDRARVQLNELRTTLKDLQGTEKQKRTRLQKLRDLLARSHKRANAAAMKGFLN